MLRNSTDEHLMYRYRPGRAKCGVLPLGTRLCVLHNRPFTVYAHLRVSKHSPYVLKFPIQSATSTLHFKNLCVWGDDRTVAGWKYAIQNHYAGVITVRLRISNLYFKVSTPGVTMNCILLTYNVSVATPGTVI